MSIGGYAYRFQQPNQILPQQPVEQPQAPEFQPMQSGLANVEELTNNYYNAYQTMKDFVGEMSKNYGVDVTKPDFKEVGGGMLHQAYQKFNAALRTTADELTTYKKTLEQEDKARIEGKFVRPSDFDANSQQGFEAQGLARGYSTELLPEVQQFRTMRDRLYTTEAGKQQADTIMQGMRDELTTKIQQAKSTGEREYYQMNLNALHDPTWEQPPTERNAELAADTARRKLEATRKQFQGVSTKIVDAGKKIINDAHGVWPPGTYETITNEDGQSEAIKKIGWEGQVFGEYTDANGVKKQKIAKYLKMTPDGKTFIVFTDPTFEPIRLDNVSADEAVKFVYKNNSRLGKVADWDMATQLLGIRDEVTGAVPAENLFTPNEWEQRQSIAAGIPEELSKTNLKVQEAEKVLTDAMSKSTGGFFQSPGELPTFNIKGNDIKFKPNFSGGTYSLSAEDRKKLLPTVEERQKTKTANLTPKDVLKLLRKHGYFDQGATFDSKTIPVGTVYDWGGGYGTSTFDGTNWIDAQGNIDSVLNEKMDKGDITSDSPEIKSGKKQYSFAPK